MPKNAELSSTFFMGAFYQFSTEVEFFVFHYVVKPRDET